MTMKKLYLSLITIIILLSGCSSTLVDIEQVTPVRVVELQAEDYTQYLKYIGIISSDDLIKYSFKTGGTLASLNYRVGEKVQSGDVLATLDKRDTQVAVSVAKSQMDAAKAQYDKALTGATAEEKRAAELNYKKASDAYAFALDNLQKLEVLYEAGALSKSQLDSTKLEVDLLESDLAQAEQMHNQAMQGARQEDIASAMANYEQAKTNYEYQLRALSETELRSTIDGYVATITFEPGEIIGAGYPIVVVRSESQVANFGIAQRDIKTVDIGISAHVEVLDEIIDGTLVSIDEMPDETTGTYQAKVLLGDGSFRLGLIADVNLVIGESSGIWVPLDSIMFSGDSYVLIAESEKAVRKNVTVIETRNTKAMVEGLSEGDLLIIANSNLIKPGDKIEIVES
jgi:multidrug efflux pump subunit AcrA (membrane-fusion protein)